MKKILSLVLVLVMCMTLALSAFATTISPDQCKAIALESIDYTRLIYNVYELAINKDDVEVYNVSTMVEVADGTYSKYTTVIDANNGEILNKSCRLNASLLDDILPGENDGIYLSRDKALVYAYKAFGVNANEVTLISVEENAVGAVAISYDITFAIGYGTKYTCTVYAETGVIDEMEIYQPAARDIIGRIMLAVEIVIATVKNKIRSFLPI